MKSSGATYSIGALAARFGLATHVLRHWEAVGLLTPATRVSGRRRYTDDHVTRVVMILRGKQAGFSLAQLQEMLTAPDPATRRVLMQRHRDELDARLSEILESRKLIDHALACEAEDFTQCRTFQRLVHSLVTQWGKTH
ncbi:helix-turn-helix domain-containing protein [Pseudonocardia sp. TRM90224]|uniref:helix-turn-helix domain-containing protein n=1 Tax=Pseudonocardia sp. TRM90224 TaxID=2812678 RepID=UPI001E4A86AE|nr:MerR family transcriptional regulator [Pseudonocardia sp. TRM90224]